MGPLALGFVLFLGLEVLFLPFRHHLVNMLQNILPAGYMAVWPCTGMDELFLYVSFLAPLRDNGRKAWVMVGGSLLIVLFNFARIFVVVHAGSPLLHEVLFRVGGFVFILVLYFFSLKALGYRLG